MKHKTKNISLIILVIAGIIAIFSMSAIANQGTSHIIEKEETYAF